MRTALAWLGFVMLSASCVPKATVVPDWTVPHQLSRPAEAYLLLAKPSGGYMEGKFLLPQGWWCVSPEVVK